VVPEIQNEAEGAAKDPLLWLSQVEEPMLTEEGEGDEAAKEPKKPFENLDLVEAFCFGWCPAAAENCWANIADASITRGWKNTDVRRLDVDLKKNVDACYFFPCQGSFRDLDTGYLWRAAFVADHMLWKLELPESEGAEVLPEDAKAFFSSEYFMKFAKRCGDLIGRAKKIYEKVVDQHLRNGELMSVDVPKLERILHDASVTRFTDNLRRAKYELQ